jgi:hypothetical protein
MLLAVNSNDLLDLPEQVDWPAPVCTRNIVFEKPCRGPLVQLMDIAQNCPKILEIVKVDGGVVAGNPRVGCIWTSAEIINRTKFVGVWLWHHADGSAVF